MATVSMSSSVHALLKGAQTVLVDFGPHKCQKMSQNIFECPKMSHIFRPVGFSRSRPVLTKPNKVKICCYAWWSGRQLSTALEVRIMSMKLIVVSPLTDHAPRNGLMSVSRDSGKQESWEEKIKALSDRPEITLLTLRKFEKRLNQVSSTGYSSVRGREIFTPADLVTN